MRESGGDVRKERAKRTTMMSKARLEGTKESIAAEKKTKEAKQRASFAFVLLVLLSSLSLSFASQRPQLVLALPSARHARETREREGEEERRRRRKTKASQRCRNESEKSNHEKEMSLLHVAGRLFGHTTEPTAEEQMSSSRMTSAMVEQGGHNAGRERERISIDYHPARLDAIRFLSSSPFSSSLATKKNDKNLLLLGHDIGGARAVCHLAVSVDEKVRKGVEKKRKTLLALSKDSDEKEK